MYYIKFYNYNNYCSRGREGKNIASLIKHCYKKLFHNKIKLISSNILNINVNFFFFNIIYFYF